MQTRYAINEDIPRIIELSHKAVTEIQFFREIVDEVISNTLQVWIDSPDYFCRVIADDNDIVVGGIITRISRTWFNDDIHAEGVAIFIEPTKRGFGGAAKLYREYVEWAKGFDMVKYISFQTTSGLDLSSIITRVGGKHIGHIYRLELDR
jgi:GNAT superfamily N-acetyltransferase